MLTPAAQLRKDTTQPTGNAVFQHRHYAELARIVREENTNDAMRRQMAAILAEGLASHNANFDRKRFLAACEA